MPYYKWCGVNLLGHQVRGRLFAQSVEKLDDQLFKRKIALLVSRPAYSWHFFARVRVGDKIAIFRQLFVLVTAGVLLPEALAIVAEQTQHAALEEVMYTSALCVQEGEAFSVVAHRYPTLNDSLMVQLLTVGEQSGTLPIALEAIVAYLQAKQDFHTQMNAALFMPVVTLVFFIIVVSLIFTFIIPRFADMFASLGQQLPPLTKTMMGVSDFVLSWSFAWVVLGIVCALTVLIMLKKTERGTFLWQNTVLHLPCIGNLVACQVWGYFFESVGLLLAGGMQLVPALEAVQGTVSHHIFYETISGVIESVKQGNTFSYALQVVDDKVVSADIVSIVRIGQEVGALDTMLKQVAVIYHNKVKKTVSFFTMIIQPLLIVILGLLILLLIVALYTPILNMSYAI
ncbi:MAG: type II secretion system F family protein [Candidatus Dependentiae bacterium]|nr:type II secretion system F family protein [Candidatus Dependentiae bacterium]